jgi:hypothetical protein
MNAVTSELVAVLNVRERLDVDPPHLAPFGALVQLGGHLAEVIGWLSPNPKEKSSFAREHVAILSIVDGVLITGDEQFGFAPESEVVLVKLQDEPRLMSENQPTVH